jgi:hypothetical protein
MRAILSVHDRQVDTILLLDLRQKRIQRLSAWLADDISDCEYQHFAPI